MSSKMKEELLFSERFSSFPLFPEPVEKHGRSLIKSEDNRGEDKPVDVEIRGKKKDESCYSGYRGRMEAARRRCENISFILLIPAQE